MPISEWHGDAVTSPTLEIWSLFGQNFSTFGHIIQLHSHLSEVMFIFLLSAKALLRLFCHSFLPLMAKQTLPLNELELFDNSNSLHQIWAN